MDVQIQLAMFKPSDPIFTLSFLHNFKPVRDSSGVHEGAPKRLFQHFLTYIAKAALVHRVCAAEDDDLQRERKLIIYFQDVNYLLGTYATDYMILGAESEVKIFKQNEYTCSVEYSKVLQKKIVRSGSVYEEVHLKGVFIERLHEHSDSLEQPTRVYKKARRSKV